MGTAMKLTIDNDFREICREIVAKGEAAFVDSDDLYQQGNFCGGWDEEHGVFAFSFYAPDGGDYIFSLSVEEARVVAEGGSIDPPLKYWKKAPIW